jgi:hypothetical protein
MRLLKLLFLLGLWLGPRIVRKILRTNKRVHPESFIATFLVKLTADVILHLRVAAPGCSWRQRIWIRLGTIPHPHNMKECLTLCDLSPQHSRHRPPIWFEICLFDRMAVDRQESVLHNLPY